MKILYDYQAFTNVVSGASRAYCKIGSILGSDHDIIWGTKRSSNEYLKQIVPDIKPLLGNINFKGKNRIIKYLEQRYSSSLIKADNFDVMYATGEELYYLDIIKRPFIVTIHDMIPENYTKDPVRISKRASLLEKATRVVAVSQNTKRELVNLYPEVNVDKIDVVYHGFEKLTKSYGANLWGKYILFVGQRQSYKNFQFFVDAISPLLQKDHKLNLLCTGPGFNMEELGLLAKLNISSKVRSVGYVSDAILFDLYHYAETFVFPSLYEGFGIPILEAFGNDCPAVISNASCFPEIGGDAVAYFDPNDKRSMLDVIQNVVSNKQYANELRERGRERVKLFKWEGASENMNTTFKNAVSKLDKYQ